MDFSTREISKSDEGHSWKPHLHTLVMRDRMYSSLDHGKPHLHALLMEDRVYSSQDHGFVYSRPVPHCSKALHSHTIITRRRLSHKMKERQIASVPLTGNMSLWIIKRSLESTKSIGDNKWGYKIGTSAWSQLLWQCVSSRNREVELETIGVVLFWSLNGQKVLSVRFSIENYAWNLSVKVNFTYQ